jgi:hypothetical protein
LPDPTTPLGTAFVSYSSRDRREAFAIKRLLESHQIKVWLDFFDIQTTAELRQELATKVRQAGLFCLLLSPAAVESPWVGQEVETALAARKEGLRVLPIILRPCRIPAELDNIVGFDASEGLEHEAVRLRLVRAVCGEGSVNDGILLDAANRLLVANREIALRADAELPAVAAQMAPVSRLPIRNVTLAIRPETLPEDPKWILELQLELDTLSKGRMSFYVARYREGRTWPEELGFREPPFTKFFLTGRPRLDVQFKWFERVIPLGVEVDGTDLKTLPATFTLELDGATFKPRGDLNLPQTFEIPSLDALEKQHSQFRLIAHDTEAKQAREIEPDTDIDLTLTAAAGEGNVCLYASHTTPLQRVVLRSEYMIHVEHAIRRTALLRRYAGVPAYQDLRPEIAAALEKGELESDEQRRLAAQLRFSEAIQARFKTLHRDAYEKFLKTAELLRPLVMERRPTLADATLMYRACRASVETWLRQESFPQAGQMGETLGSVAQSIVGSDPANPDFQRMWSDAVLLNARIHAKLGEMQRAGAELREGVEARRALYAALPSAERRIDYLQALSEAMKNAANWGLADLVDLVPMTAWKAALESESGEPAAEELTRAEELPAWLKRSDPAGWPTIPLQSEMLRYSLRIPQRLRSEPEVRASSREVEHAYHGARNTEWLIITFMDKANATSDMRNWVEPILATSGFPVAINLDPMPQLARWRYLGRLPGLASGLDVDEAHAYTGLAKYTEADRTILGRLYIVMAWRKNFAWKLALSIETALFEGMPEEMVYAQDHVRAGAVFGTLQLGDPRDTKAKSS